MIRRDSGGTFFLITQDDHAAVSGQLAAHFGTGKFARPVSRELVLTAISRHDMGWPLHDDEPTLNGQSRPLDVFEVPRPIALQVWAASAERAAAIDPYVGLLVSLHSLSLSIQATAPAHAREHERFDVARQQAQFDINKFQHREVERQEQLRRKLGFRTDVPLKHGIAEAGVTAADNQLRFHFRLLQAMDLLSLCVCCTHPPATETGELLPSPEGEPLKLKLFTDSDSVLRVRPWPFDLKRIVLDVPGRRISPADCESQARFRQAYAAAPTSLLTVALAP